MYETDMGMIKMNAFNAELLGAPGSSRQRSQLRLRKTSSGFSVTDNGDRVHNNALEMALRAMGILLIPLGAVPLFSEKIPSIQSLNIPNAGLALGMAIVGVALFIYASRGLSTELRVDSGKREVRVGTVNARGKFTLRQILPADEAESFF